MKIVIIDTYNKLCHNPNGYNQTIRVLYRNCSTLLFEIKFQIKINQRV